MELAESQDLMARLLVEPEALDRYFAAGTGSFEGLPERALRRFATSLLAKRRGEVAKLLPGTVRCLGPARFQERFREHAAARPTQGPKRHRDDAIGFAESLADEGWTGDLARLEAFPLRAESPGTRLSRLGLRHRPVDLLRASREPRPPETLPRRPTLLIAFRLRPNGPVRYVRLGW